eukprot:SAG31_NODE_47451_length_242_cov_10.321678_1_plen_28_part_01
MAPEVTNVTKIGGATEYAGGADVWCALP